MLINKRVLSFYLPRKASLAGQVNHQVLHTQIRSSEIHAYDAVLCMREWMLGGGGVMMQLYVLENGHKEGITGKNELHMGSREQLLLRPM